MTSARFRIVTASVLGALAIHLTFTACAQRAGPDGSTAGGGTAHAQTPSAPPCAQWNVQAFTPKTFQLVEMTLTDSDGVPFETSFWQAGAFDLPEGYEPFAGDSFGSISARRCIKYAE